MNKTVTVNIGGIVFHIDENAYERFKQYLESIRMHFTGSEGRDEIMQDIESRIAEMFQERIGDNKQVITLVDVEEVTTIMGKPEQFADEDATESTEKDKETQVNIKRRLFRNPDEKVIGGVCSGISAYFDIDPVWMRLAFVLSLFLGGIGLFIYPLLWIILPNAETTAEKLQMRGEPVTVDNIKRNVQEELDQVKKRLSEIRTDAKPGNFLTRLFDAIGQLIRFVFIFIGKVFSALFVFIGVMVAFLLFVSVLAFLKVPGTSYPEVLNQLFPNNFLLGLSIFAGLIVIGIPFLMLAYFGARVLFNIRKSSRTFNMSVLGLWIGGVITCIFIGVSVAKDFSERASIRKEIPVLQPSTNTLVLQVENYKSGEKAYERWDDEEWNGDWRLSMDEFELQSKDIMLDVVESPDDSFHVEQICFSRGSSRKVAEDLAARIDYSFSQVDSVLSFKSYFTISKDEKYRGQRVQLLVKVPKGGTIYLDRSVRNIIYDIDNVENIYDGDMIGRHWKMTEKGLSCVDCDGTENAIGIPRPPRRPGDRRNDHNIIIDERGVYIGDDEDEIRIDSTGIRIN